MGDVDIFEDIAKMLVVLFYSDNTSLSVYRLGQVDFLWYDKNSEQLNITETINSIMSNTTTKRTEAPTPFIHTQRIIKSASEIKLMRRTCEIASEAINETIKNSKPGLLNGIISL